MRIAVSGSTGLIGAALVARLLEARHHVWRIVRTRPHEMEAKAYWNPNAGEADLRRLEGFDAVVHLAGENIAARRWNEEQKQRIRRTRVPGTRLLAEHLAGLASPPKVLVCASAVGYYGDRGDEVLTERSAPGTGFLADTCREWEEAAQPAAAKGVRVIHCRFGVVLNGRGGALAKMLPPFRMGAGGVLGSGRQYMSWITLEDAVGAILHLLGRPGASSTGNATPAEFSGPVNVVAPQPVTNKAFTRALGRALGRPTLFWMPRFAVRAAFGEMADELLLASQRAEPVRLVETGYKFQHSAIESGLAAALANGG